MSEENLELEFVRHSVPAGGVYTALVYKRGNKWMYVIYMDAAGITLRKVNSMEMRWMRKVDYTPKQRKKALKVFMKAGKQFGITKSAKKALKEMLA